MTKVSFKVLAVTVGVIALLSIVFGLLGLFLGWFQAGTEIVSPQNVKEQWRFAYRYEEDLQAAARQVCNAQKTLNAATTDTERSQRQSQLLARQDNYARIAAEYNARLRNAFEAGLIKPADVREQAPTLDRMIAELRLNCE